jgi:shikimate kinase
VNTEGKSINDIFREQGEEYFRLKEKEVLHIITESHGSFVMACGGGTPCYFNNVEYMNSQGTTVWLNTSLPVLYERLIKEKAERPLLRDLSDDQLKAFISKKFSDRRIYYEQSRVAIEDDDIPMEQMIELIFHA